MRRAIELEGAGATLELSKVTTVSVKARMIHLDELPDGTWRLTYNRNMLPDFEPVSALKFANMAGKKLKDASVTLEGLGLTLPVSKASGIEAPTRTIQLDLMRDDTWRLIYSRDLVPDLSQLTALKVIRED
jgi:hypothetical protein